MSAQDLRLAAIAEAAARTLRVSPYHVVRAKDVAAAVRLPRETGHTAGRSAVWLYNEVRNRRVLVALAASYAWNGFLAGAGGLPIVGVGSVRAAREAVAEAMTLIVRFHRAETVLMTQVGYGIGDIATAEKRQLAEGADLVPPTWPDSGLGRVATAAWEGRCGVFADFLHPVLWRCVQSVTYLPDAAAAASASLLSDIAFRTCLADRDGPVERIAHGLAAMWFERDLVRLANGLPHDLESGELAFAATARRATDPRAEANALAVVIRVLLEAGTLYARCVRESQQVVSLWREVARAGPPAGAPAGGPARTRYDPERLSDAASHLGLAALRYGDTGVAGEAWTLSRDVAERDLGADASRIARADTNMAALAAETGHGQEAWQRIQVVAQARAARLAEAPDDPPSWRRFTATARTQADVARCAWPGPWRPPSWPPTCSRIGGPGREVLATRMSRKPA